MRKMCLWGLVAVSVAACGSDERERKTTFDDDPVDMGSTTEMDQGASGTDTGTVVDVPEPLRCDQETPCELTCDVLLDPGFCWNVGVLESYACMDGAGDGVMAGDGLSCGDGDWLAEFGAPIVQDMVTGRDLWDVTVTRGSQTCAQYEDTGDDMTLITANSKSTVSVDPDVELYTVTCNDEDVWQTMDPFSLGACMNDDGVSNIPGRGVGSIGAEWSFQLLPEGASLFHCSF